MKLKSMLLIIQSIVCLLIVSQQIKAQSEITRFEAGGHFSTISSINPNTFSSAEVSADNGFGGIFTLNFTRNIAIETELNYFPKDSISKNIFIGNTGQKIQLLAGFKAGIRKKRFGVFGKVRPGYLHLTRNYLGNRQTTSFFTDGSYQNNPVLDLGGVVEFYTSRRLFARIDIGDSIVKYGTVGIYDAEFGTNIFSAGGVKHSLQINVGFGIRFG